MNLKTEVTICLVPADADSAAVLTATVKQVNARTRALVSEEVHSSIICVNADKYEDGYKCVWLYMQDDNTLTVRLSAADSLVFEGMRSALRYTESHKVAADQPRAYDEWYAQLDSTRFVRIHIFRNPAL